MLTKNPQSWLAHRVTSSTRRHPRAVRHVRTRGRSSSRPRCTGTLPSVPWSAGVPAARHAPVWARFRPSSVARERCGAGGLASRRGAAHKALHAYVVPHTELLEPSGNASRNPCSELYELLVVLNNESHLFQAAREPGDCQSPVRGVVRRHAGTPPPRPPRHPRGARGSG